MTNFLFFADQQVVYLHFLVSQSKQIPLGIHVFGLHGFGYTCPRKIMNIERIDGISYTRFSGALK